MIDLDKLRQVADELTEEHGPFKLFGLFLRANAPLVWDLVVSAPWLEVNERVEYGALHEITKKLTATMGEEAMIEFSRVAFVKTSHPAVESVLCAMRVKRPRGTGVLYDRHFFGQEISEAHIIIGVDPA